MSARKSKQRRMTSTKTKRALPSELPSFVSAVESSTAFFRDSLCEIVKSFVHKAGFEETSGGNAFNAALDAADAAINTAARNVRVRKAERAHEPSSAPSPSSSEFDLHQRGDGNPARLH
jgi:hypothetical protein